MSDKTAEFVNRLFQSQQMSPALRASYEEELERLRSPRLTSRSAIIGGALLVMLVGFTLGLVRNMIVREADALTFTGWVILAGAFAYASYLIVHDLWRRKHSPKAVSSIAGALYFAAGVLTVVALLLGLQEPEDPASMFNAFFVFVFYVACLGWSIESRIAAAELAAREQSLRVEWLLADAAQRMGK